MGMEDLNEPVLRSFECAHSKYLSALRKYWVLRLHLIFQLVYILVSLRLKVHIDVFFV